MVCEFLKVFPTNLRGMPPEWDIDFIIDLEPGNRLISILLYWMTPIKLKVQLQELFSKRFIHPSASLWGAPILFVKMKYVSIRMCID